MPPSRATISDLFHNRRRPTALHSGSHQRKTAGDPRPTSLYQTRVPPRSHHADTPQEAPSKADQCVRPSTHEDNIKRVLEHSLAKRTTANYASATRTFTKFCSDNGFSPMPAAEFTLCAFAASLASKMAGSSIANIFSGLKAWHSFHNAPWNCSPRLQLVLRGAHALAPSTSTRAQRAPVTIDMLLELDSKLSTSSPFDRAVRAVALVAFWGQCRLGELLGTSKSHHDPALLPSRSSLGPSISSNGSRKLHLPSTKTEQTAGETIAITRQGEGVDPIEALHHHLRLSQDINSTAHLFAYWCPKRKAVLCPTRDDFLTRCNGIWMDAGFGRITGHSFRIGGTTELLRAQVAPEVVRSMGRWGSDAHFRYWRNPQEIAVGHAERLHRPYRSAPRTFATVPHGVPAHASRTQPRSQGDRLYGSFRP